MSTRLCVLAITLVILGLLTVGPGIASAQDVFKINYFANANVSGAPDATVRIDNPGVTYGNLCAMIYVFDNDQQLTECCGCLDSHNGLRTLSVNKDLTSNPLTGVKSNNGVIKVVSALVNDSWCDPTSNVTPTPNLRVWTTHIQNKVGSAFPITETESSDSALISEVPGAAAPLITSSAELIALQAQCYFLNILGSGHGICTCGTGDSNPPPCF